MRKSFLILLSLLVLSGACEKTEPKAKGLFLKQIVYHRNVDQIGQYSYSDDGRFLNYEYWFNGMNPLYKLSYPPDFISYFSPNNVLKNKSSTFTYEYNSSDLPVKRHEKYELNGYTSETDIEYVYEEL